MSHISPDALVSLGRAHIPRLLPLVPRFEYAKAQCYTPSAVPRSGTLRVTCVPLNQVSLCEPTNHRVAISTAGRPGVDSKGTVHQVYPTYAACRRSIS